MNKLFPLAAVVLIAACSTTYTYYDPDKPHRVPEGFRNNYAYDPIGVGFWKFAWERWRDDLPRHPEGGYRFPLQKPDVAFLKANRGEPTMTWLGHATLLMQIGGEGR